MIKNASGMAAQRPDRDAMPEYDENDIFTPAVLKAFYIDVCREAERIMEHTGTVSGAHWNAMKRVLKRHGVEVE